jgi:hypothetical protein
VVQGSEELTRAVQRSWARERERFTAAVSDRVGRGGEHSRTRLSAQVLAAQIIATIEQLTTINQNLTGGLGRRSAVRQAHELADTAFSGLAASVKR